MPDDQQTTDVSKGSISPSAGTSIEIIEHGRQFHMHRLTEPELDNLASGFNSIHMNFFTLSVGMLAGFAITLLTVGAELSDRMFAVFIALTAVAVIGTIYFGIKAFAERRALDKLIKRIKEGRT